MATSVETVSPPSLSSTEHSMSSANDDGPMSFFCRQCQSPYKQPKILTCLHSFCSQCLQQVLEKSTDKHSITCLLCACVTKVPAGGISELTSNSFLLRISNEYVKEVKHNLATKSLRDATGTGSETLAGKDHLDDIHEQRSVSEVYGRSASETKSASLTPGIKSAFHEELEEHRFTNLTDEQKSETSRALQSGGGGGGSNSSSRSSSQSAQGKSSTIEASAATSSNGNVSEAIKNMNRLQAKSMGLQGEALRVTYAIDHVNNHKEEWIQRREDLKRAIQRRSAQFQSLVKKMERQLISQIEDKIVEDKFHESLDKGKNELRKNLKQVLHEVSVIKSVREMGNDEEINELSPALLGPSVGVGDVILDDIKYQFDLPTKSIDEMVRVGFGNLVTTHEKKSVYAPDLKDYATLNMAEITSVEERSHSTAFKSRGGILSAISGDQGRKKSGYRSASVVGRRSSDVGKADAVLEEFQNARESLRNRRQEILRQSQSSREASPWRGGGSGGVTVAATARRISRPATRRGRAQVVQSLDRGSDTRREEANLLSKLKTTNNTGGVAKTDDLDSLTTSVEVYDVATGGLTDSYRIDETSTTASTTNTTMPSPIIEEAGLAVESPRTNTVPKLTTAAMASSPTIALRQRTISNTSNDASYLEATRSNRGHLSCSSSTSSSRRVSFDMSPSMSPTSEFFPIELFGKNMENSRQLRKAMTGAADKKAKIEFLRENWQRRKEILIQNRGFVSSDETGSATKPDSSSVSALISENPATTPENGTAKLENSTHTEIALATRGIGSPPLRSKFTSVRKSQINDKRYQSSPDTSRSPSTSGGSPNVTRKAEIPASILDSELRKIEAGNVSAVEFSSSSSRLFTTNQTIHSNLGASKTIEDKKTDDKQEDDEEEEEEETVFETETISIPFTTELLQDMKSPLREVSIPSRETQSVTSAMRTPGGIQERNFKTSSAQPEEDQETFFEDTIIVSLPNKTNNSRSSIKSETTSSLYSPRPATRKHQTPSNNPNNALVKTSAAAVPSSSSKPTTITTDTKSGISTSSKTTTLPSNTSLSRPASETATPSSFLRSYGTATTTSSSRTGDTLDDKTDASRKMATTFTTDRTPSFYRRTANDPDQPENQPSSTSSSSSSSLSSNRAEPLNTTTGKSIILNTQTPPTATTCSTTTTTTTTTNRPTTKSLYQYSTANTITTTTTTTTTASSSSSSSSSSTTNSSSSTTSSSYSTRRYIPKTETIDVAALLSNFYKTTSSSPSASSSSDRDTKTKTNEDNKENLAGKETTTNTSSTTKTQAKVEAQSSGSSLLNNKTNTNNSSKTDPNSTKTDITVDANKTEIGNNAITHAQSRYGSSFLRNYYNSTTDNNRYTTTETSKEPTTEKQTAPHPSPSQTNRSSKITDTNTSTTSHATKTGTQTESNDRNSMTTNKPQTTTITATSDTTTTTTTTTTKKHTTTKSLYSRYYSIPNPLYSKPPEPTTSTTNNSEESVDKNSTTQENTTNNITSSTSSGRSTTNTSTISRQTTQDLQVQETFTQAESTRRVYEPPSSTPSEQPRRHTADIRQTIPTGVKLSDFYSKPSTTTTNDNNDSLIKPTRSITPRSQTAKTIMETSLESSESDKDATNFIKPQPKPTRNLYQPSTSSYYSAVAHSASNSSSPSLDPPLIPIPQQRDRDPPSAFSGKFDLESPRTQNTTTYLPGEANSQHLQHQSGESQPTTKTPQGQKVMSLSFHQDLSAASSPTDSPLMEENELFTQSGQLDDSSGAMAGSAGNRSLKEIARKKRERWRRLTVY